MGVSQRDLWNRILQDNGAIDLLLLDALQPQRGTRKKGGEGTHQKKKPGPLPGQWTPHFFLVPFTCLRECVHR